MIDEILCSPNRNQDPMSHESQFDLPIYKPEDYGDTSLVSLSVFGVRFRCPICDYLDVNVRFVRDHMKQCHKAKKEKEISPKRQEMKVRIKPPRVYKETVKQALAYYKSFGGQFFKTGVCAQVTFVREPQMYICNVKGGLGLNEDRPCPKRFKRKFSNSSDDRKSVPPPSPKPGPVCDNTSVQSWEIVKLRTPVKKNVENLKAKKSLKRKREDSELNVKKRKSEPKQGIPKVKLRKSSTVSSSSGEAVSSILPESSVSDLGLEMRPGAEAPENCLSISSFLAETENDNVDDFMKDMNTLLSEETEISFKSIIEDGSITDLSQAISEDLLNDLNIDQNNDLEERTVNVMGKRELAEETCIKNNIEEPDRHEKKTKQKNNGSEVHTSNGIDISNTVRRNPKLVSTCHYCKIKKVTKKVKCKNKKCNVEICKSCLTELGEDVERALRNSKWLCPVCRNACDCKSCSMSMKKVLAKKEKEYLEFVVLWNYNLKQFPWSKRNYSVKVSNILEEEKYQQILEQQKLKRSKNILQNDPQSSHDPPNSEKIMEDNRKTAQRLTRKGRGVILKEGEALQKLLSYLLSLLMKKDSNKWFSVPIDDKMAPGYSDVVKEKMDFTKMENKLDSFGYITLAQFKHDFNLICQNCMKFNKIDSCYHKAAKKLESFGNQILSKKSLRDIILDRPLYSKITPDVIGFDVFDMNDTDDDTMTEQETSKSITKQNSSEKSLLTESASYGNEIEDLFISAAERVKFGRKRHKKSDQIRLSVEDSTTQKVSQDKNKLLRKGSLPKIKDEANNSISTTIHQDYLSASNKSQSECESDVSVKSSTADKIKNLHKEKAEGTYVQCCVEECKKWRFLTEFEDPSNVPEYWECSMNKDLTANKCSIGDEDQLDDDDVEFVNVRFTCGSLAWARVKGYPWWPVIIDYCPDSEEYYWIEEAESRVEPAWYHVVFLEKSVSRSWVRSENVLKMIQPVEQPTVGGGAIKKSSSSSMKSRFKKALTMVDDCMNLSLKERLKKYSFANLFKGKWGEYSDISSDEDDKSETRQPKKSKKKRKESQESSKSSTDQSFNTFETLKCEKCTEEIIYTKYPIVKHLKKHKLDLISYCLKFDPDEKNESLSLAREWICRDKFRKAIAEDPWKPNKNKKEKNKKSSEKDTTIKEFVNEPRQENKKEQPDNTNSSEPEQWHISSSLTINPLKYEKPPLSMEALIALAVRNLDPENKNGASFWQIVSFISLHFPYFDTNYETCIRLVKKGYGQNPDDDEEPTGSFRIKPAVVQRLYTKISPVLKEKKDEIEKSMMHPKFLDLMIDKFLKGENYKNQKSEMRPPYEDEQLVILALAALKKPSNLEQIIVYLHFLFPWFIHHQDSFRNSFSNNIDKSDAVEEVQYSKERRYIISENAFSEVLKDLRTFTSEKKIFDALKFAIFQEDSINILFPGLDMDETNSKDSKTLPETCENVQNCEDQNTQDEIERTGSQEKAGYDPSECPIPAEYLVFFVFALKSNQQSQEQISLQEIENLLVNVFSIKKSKLSFVKKVLWTEVYTQLPDDKFEVNPASKSFCIAALMKFLIDNLEAVLDFVPHEKIVENILPRMHQGSEKLRTDFLAQTVEFCKKKCLHWKPLIDEKLIFSFAILSTADINDCASRASILDFVYENFPWYKLTKQPFGQTIPEKKIADDHPDENYVLSSVETVLARQQLKVFVTSNVSSLSSMMPKPEVFNIVLDPHLQFQSFSNNYSKPPFAENVLVILSLLHISDDFGWSSALKIQKFVEVNFPFYQLEMATNFLTKISRWKENSEEGEFFNIKSSDMSVVKFQIKPEKFFHSYAWVSKFIQFGENDISPNYFNFMRSPQLIKDILGLPPPSWRSFYAPEKNPPVSHQEEDSDKVQLNPGFVTINKNLFQAENEQNTPFPENPQATTEWEKPKMETHLKIALSMILWDIKDFHEGEEPSVDQDVPFTMFSFHQKHSLTNIVKFVRDAFPYYEDKDHIKEFIVEEIQQNKKLIGEFFNLIRNEDGKSEYEVKVTFLGHIFEEIMNMIDWKSPQKFERLVRKTELSKILCNKSKLSVASMLSLILFKDGGEKNNFAVPVDKIIQKITNDFDIQFFGFSGKRWNDEKLKDSLKTVLFSLVQLNTDFVKTENGGSVRIGLITEEGRVDEIFANIQKSCCTVIKSDLSSNIKAIVTKFMEMPTATSLLPDEQDHQNSEDVLEKPLEPPFPRNYLIALAMKNLSIKYGNPVLMSEIWNYLTATFPYFACSEPWCMAELEVGIGFNQDTPFMYNVSGDDFTISLSPQHTEKIYKELTEFSRKHVIEIQGSMKETS